MDDTLDVWEIPPESAKRVSHPAPFPVELPARLIRLYTYEDDLVLDPFMGSGSALVAAARLGRRYAGYDLDPTYVDIARLRVRDEGRPEPLVEEQKPEPDVGELDFDGGFQARAVKEGKAARSTREGPARGRRVQHRRYEPPTPWNRRHDQLHREGRRRRGVVLRRVGRVHEHARWNASHRHGLEDTRTRARLARHASTGRSSS